VHDVGASRNAVIACPVPHTFRESPNDLRLSGERSGAERVRCSRGLGDGWFSETIGRTVTLATALLNAEN